MTDIIMPPKQNVVFDATVFTSIQKCGRFADLRFNHNLVSLNGKSNSLECGSLIHKILEEYNRSIIGGFKRDLAIANGMAAGEMYIASCPHCTGFTPSCSATAYEIENNTHIHNELCTLKPICGHQPNEYPGTPNTPPDSDSKTYKVGWKWILETMVQYFDFYRNDHWVPLEVEVVKSKILYEDDEIRILWKAKLDLTCDTNQGIFPVDHKSMKQRRDTNSLDNQFIGQCLIMNTRNVFIDKIGLQTTLKPEEKFSRPAVSYSADRLMEWQSEILPYWAKMYLLYVESGYYPPNFTQCEGKYGDCIFKKICESDRHMREEELKMKFTVGPIWNPTNDDD